ncbi:MAG: CoA-transferase subunit beta [Spirochaeta sp.]|jgi:glutaconate CoA-transferase subunit B|nr:CoA-transferase subunit beta [Spirochaeta sp.]
MNSYNEMELMIVTAARQLDNDSSVGVGTGAPCAAAMLAQRTHAPDILILFEAGGVGPELRRMPISVGDSRTFFHGVRAGTMGDIMEPCARGMVDYTFLGGAQIDMYGNLNSTIAGADHDHPKVRFPGSGGANDYASYCWRTMVMTVHDARRFVPTLDFVTTPGWLTGGDARERAGLPAGTGPYRIITNMAVLGFAEESKRMHVLSINPGHTLEEITENTGFELLWANDLTETPAPTEKELRILRDEIDPARYFIGRG